MVTGIEAATADHLLDAAREAGERVEVRNVLLARQRHAVAPRVGVTRQRAQLGIVFDDGGEQPFVVDRQRARIGQCFRRRELRIGVAGNERVQHNALRGELGVEGEQRVVAEAMP